MKIIRDEKFRLTEIEFYVFCRYLMMTESYQLITNKFRKLHRGLTLNAQEDLIFFFLSENAKLLNINVKYLVGKLCEALTVSGERQTASRIANQLFLD